MKAAFKTFAMLAGFCLAASAAAAHAFLDHATPGVGAKVTASPNELTLAFTQDVEAPLSSVRVATVGGGVIAASKPTIDPSNASLLHVKLGQPLPPGDYVVKWRVVSVDTHPTSGSYKFAVAP